MGEETPLAMITFKSSKLEGRGPGFLIGADVFCLGVLDVVVFKAGFPLLLFLSLSGLQKKKKVRVSNNIISGIDIAPANNLLTYEEKNTWSWIGRLNMVETSVKLDPSQNPCRFCVLFACLVEI